MCFDACFRKSRARKSSANLWEVHSQARGNNGRANVPMPLSDWEVVIFSFEAKKRVGWKRPAWHPVFSPVASSFRAWWQLVMRKCRIEREGTSFWFMFLSLIFSACKWSLSLVLLDSIDAWAVVSLSELHSYQELTLRCYQLSNDNEDASGNDMLRNSFSFCLFSTPTAHC